MGFHITPTSRLSRIHAAPNSRSTCISRVLISNSSRTELSLISYFPRVAYTLISQSSRIDLALISCFPRVCYKLISQSSRTDLSLISCFPRVPRTLLSYLTSHTSRQCFPHVPRTLNSNSTWCSNATTGKSLVLKE